MKLARSCSASFTPSPSVNSMLECVDSTASQVSTIINASRFTKITSDIYEYLTTPDRYQYLVHARW